MENIIDLHSKEITLIVLIVLVLATLMVLVPQLLRAHLRKMEMTHLENLKSLESFNLQRNKLYFRMQRSALTPSRQPIFFPWL